MNNPSIDIPLNKKEGQIFSLILNYCLSFPAIKPTSSINKKPRRYFTLQQRYYKRIQILFIKWTLND